MKKGENSIFKVCGLGFPLRNNLFGPNLLKTQFVEFCFQSKF